MIRKVILLVLLVALSVPVIAQDDDTSGGLARLTLDAYLPSTAFPRALDIDLEAGVYVRARPESSALVTDWQVEQRDVTDENGEVVGELLVTLTLRDDLRWGDGAPVTAYDVYTAYLSALEYGVPQSEGIIAAAPYSETELTFLFEDAGCDYLDVINTVVGFPLSFPAHLTMPDLRGAAEEIFDPSGNIVTQQRDLFQRPDFSIQRSLPSDIDYPLALAGFDIESDYDRVAGVYQVNLNDLSMVVGGSSSGSTSTVERFLDGDLNVLVNPPYPYWRDVLAVEDADVYIYPGRTVYAIGLNLADPDDPQPYIDDDGVVQEQGSHPYFSDIRVRQALALALDVDAVIEAAVQGYGVRVPALQSPLSWAFDDSIPLTPFDPVSAAALLDEAGWRDWNGDGVRECVYCEYGVENEPLYVRLYYSGDQVESALTAAIQTQWSQIGVAVDRIAGDSASGQRFDAYILRQGDSYPVNPDHALRFMPEGDRLFGTPTVDNVTSYRNDEVTQLYEQANTVGTCEIEQRAPIYREISTILAEDLPYIPLFAADEMIAARGVYGFDPLPTAPFWNIETWTVTAP